MFGGYCLVLVWCLAFAHPPAPQRVVGTSEGRTHTHATKRRQVGVHSVAVAATPSSEAVRAKSGGFSGTYLSVRYVCVCVCVGDRTPISSVPSLEITIFGLYDRTGAFLGSRQHIPDILPAQLDDFLQHYKCDIGWNFTS